jgi:hypothetical protein
MSQGDENFEAFEAGDKSRLITVLATCFLLDVPVPDWAKQAIVAAVRKRCRFEIESWDEVFGRPLKKGKQLAVARRRVELGERIWRAVHERRRAGKPIDKAMFEAIGNGLKVGGRRVSGTVVSDIYYHFMHQLRLGILMEWGVSGTAAKTAASNTKEFKKAMMAAASDTKGFLERMRYGHPIEALVPEIKEFSETVRSRLTRTSGKS